MLNSIKNLEYGAIFRGLLGAFIISFLLSLLITFILFFTPLSEIFLTPLATLIFFTSILLGSTITAKKAGYKGLIHGIAVSLIYLLLTLSIGIFISADSFSGWLLTKKIIYAVIGGSIGGILGIGLTNT